jgi:predicted small lipoprotein YifL
MARSLIIALLSAALIVGLSGCGHKAPPYYEKPTDVNGSSVAL